MPTLNIRLEDAISNSLRALAESEGVTISQFVRGLIVNRVFPVRDGIEEEDKRGDIDAPKSMRLFDRHSLALLHRILAAQLGERGQEENGSNSADHLKLADALERGFTGKYYDEFNGYYPELSIDDCRTVVDILEMFRVLTFSMETLGKAGEGVDAHLARHLRFKGFDGNHPLEGHMASYVDYLIEEGRWSELRPQIEEADNGNSHSEMLPTYLRMLTAHATIMNRKRRGIGSYLLTLDELKVVSEVS